MNVKRFIYGAPFLILLLIYGRGEEDRLVHSLKARGYSEVQIEHPTNWHCGMRTNADSYRARSPGGTPVHEGACVHLFFPTVTEPIGKK